MDYILIPARRGSKGFPFKNRSLVVPLIEKVLSYGFDCNIILSTNDEHIIEACKHFPIIIRERPEQHADDVATMKSVLLDVIEHCSLEHEKTILTLYPTYPERTKQEIEGFFNFYKNNSLSSALCKKSVATHPYMCLKENGIFHETLIDHELYRRQDYPACFELSHYLCLHRVKEVEKINNQLYNSSTGFFPIEEKIDVDYEKDYKKWKNK